MTSEEASVRFVESFYPQSTADSHVLLLSPQTELSPLYYHYLKYHLLEYRYSSYGFQSPQNLVGISLELPSSYLNGSSPFIPPLSKPSPFSNIKSDQPTSFLWQAPSSHAALYFGDKWIEFHSFLSKRLEAHHSHTQTNKPSQKRTKLVSEQYPSWMEYLLELMRVRGYSMFYPHFVSDDAIVTIHNELYQPPEEFASRSSLFSSSSFENSTTTLSPHPADNNDIFTADPATSPPHPPANNPEPTLLTTSLLSLLPAEGDLPELTSIPLLSHLGDTITSADSTTLATFFTGRFRSEIGGCTAGMVKTRRSLSASDLYCLEDDVDEDEDEDEVVLDEVVMEQRSDREGFGSLTKPSLSVSTATTTIVSRSVSVSGEGATSTGPVGGQVVASAEL